MIIRLYQLNEVMDTSAKKVCGQSDMMQSDMMNKSAKIRKTDNQRNRKSEKRKILKNLNFTASVSFRCRDAGYFGLVGVGLCLVGFRISRAGYREIKEFD